jgi:hypothetical protein
VAAGLAQRHGGATAYPGGGDGDIQTIEERRLWTGRSKRWRGGRGIGGAVGAARAAVGTRTRHGPDNAFMVWRVRGHRRMAATWRRCADEWVRRREKEADRWDPATVIFRIKNYSQMKIAQKNSSKLRKISGKFVEVGSQIWNTFHN